MEIAFQLSCQVDGKDVVVDYEDSEVVCTDPDLKVRCAQPQSACTCTTLHCTSGFRMIITMPMHSMRPSTQPNRLQGAGVDASCPPQMQASFASKPG